MKIAHYNDMMAYLQRPPDKLSKEEKKKIVKDFYKKTEEPKAKPMGIVKYIDKMNRLYGNGDDPKEIDPKEMEDIKKSLPVPEMVKKEERFNDKILKRDKYETPKKKIIKETLIAKKELPKDWKPQYLNGNVINMTPLIDDDWWSIFGEDPPKEDDVRVPTKADIEKILNIKRKEVAGLEAILSPGRKIT